MQGGSAGYEVKKGAQLAIKLCTENAKRMRLSLPPTSEEEVNEEAEKEVREVKEGAEKEEGPDISKQSGGLTVTVSDQDLTPFTSVNPSQNSLPLKKHRQGKTSLVISPSISLSSDSGQAPMRDDFVDSSNSMDSLNSKISRDTRCKEWLKRKEVSLDVPGQD